jgi:uncharacterized protein
MEQEAREQPGWCSIRPARSGLDPPTRQDGRSSVAPGARLGRVRQSVSLITLGVSDHARAKAFYEALGWAAALEVEETTFFAANGVVLVLWSREKLAADCGLGDEGAGFDGIALAHNVGSAQEVHEVIERARSLGAEISREPAETFYGGYAGVFRDPDGHCWEVAHNPGFGLAADGTVILPAPASP